MNICWPVVAYVIAAYYLVFGPLIYYCEGPGLRHTLKLTTYLLLVMGVGMAALAGLIYLGTHIYNAHSSNLCRRDVCRLGHLVRANWDP